MLKDMSCREFAEVLASKAPVPGGGGASALCGALGAALGSMVGELTVGKKKYADVEEDIKALMVKAADVRERLIELIDKDAESFEPLAKAYGMPKETEEQQAEKERVMQTALRAACDTPMQIMRTVCQALDITAEFAAKGSKLAISDAGCAAALCRGALQAASLNVFINTMSMTDRAYADGINEEANAMLERYCALAETIFDDVRSRF